MAETAPVGLGLEKTRGPAPGAATNYGMQWHNCGAESACMSRAHDASPGRMRPWAWWFLLLCTTSLVNGTRSLLQLQSIRFTLGHAQRPETIPARCFHRNAPGGAARDMARGITPQELANGGVINGLQYDPVAYIVAGLPQQFAQWDDASRLAATTQLLAFPRRRGEVIHGVLSRYDVGKKRHWETTS